MMKSFLITVLLCAAYYAYGQNTPYHGTFIGDFSTLAHDVSGSVYAVDEKRIRIIGFSYDGDAPDAYLWSGNGTQPNSDGFIIPVQEGSDSPLGSYSDVDIEVTIPGPWNVSDLPWLSVWCRRFRANFGHVTFPWDLTVPAIYNLGPLGFSPRVHNTYADAVWILDPKRIKMVNLVYDGFGPDAYFWIGIGSKPTSAGFRIPDENGSPNVIRDYNGETITLTLPDDFTLFDIDYIGLWCVLFRQDFGHVLIPKNLTDIYIPPLPLPPPPPTPAPTLPTTTTATKATTIIPTTVGKMEFCNCESISVCRLCWLIDGADVIIRVGCPRNGNETGRYFAFGVSGSSSGTQMTGGDVVVTFLDDSEVPRAVDYYLGSRGQCTPQDGGGACPDVISSMSPDTNDVTLVESSSENGWTDIVYRRPLIASDSFYDKSISTSAPTYVIWARGQINQDGRVAYHFSERSPANSNLQIDFGRPSPTCPPVEVPTGTPINPSPSPSTSSSSAEGWLIDDIVAPEDTTFTVEMGLTGGTKGYNYITGQVGWGIAWFIDDLLIPELILTRGRTYTFLISGGDDPSSSANYHPFYITNDPFGGYAQQSQAEKEGVDVYAGPEEGPLCQWATTSATGDPDSYETFEDFRETLTRNCQPGAPGVLVWTVPLDAPDLLYYHCYTHRWLGWKIHLVDGDEGTTAKTASTTETMTTTTMTQSTSPDVTDSGPLSPVTTISIVSSIAAFFAVLSAFLAIGWWTRR